MTCDGEECIHRHCAICGYHLDGGELTCCWNCVSRARYDLVAIADLCALLPAHARHGSITGHLIAAESPPGGDAVVMLSRGSEGLSDDGTTNPGDPEPPAFVLGWWTECWRESLGFDSKLPVWRRSPDRVITEAQKFLNEHLDWAAGYHPGFRQFARDLGATRRQLEALLRAGDRPLQGVQCFECSVPLERVYRARRDCKCPPKMDVAVTEHPSWEANHRGHDQGGLSDPSPDAGWACPSCRRSYSDGEYRIALSVAYDSCAEWRAQADVTRLTGVPGVTVRVWANRGHIRRRKDSFGVFYSISDIRNRLAEDLPDDAA